MFLFGIQISISFFVDFLLLFKIHAVRFFWFPKILNKTEIKQHKGQKHLLLGIIKIICFTFRMTFKHQQVLSKEKKRGGGAIGQKVIFMICVWACAWNCYPLNVTSKHKNFQQNFTIFEITDYNWTEFFIKICPKNSRVFLKYFWKFFIANSWIVSCYFPSMIDVPAKLWTVFLGYLKWYRRIP